MQFTGKINSEGKIILNDAQKFERFRLSLKGKAISLKLEELKKKRTNSQNAYYWGIVLPISANFFGYNIDEMHEAWKIKFLKTHLECPLPTLISTTELSTTEFKQFINRIQILCSEMGCYIPDPDEYYYQE